MWSDQDELYALRAWQPTLEDARELGVERSWAASSFHRNKSLRAPTGIDAWRYQFSAILNQAAAWGVIHSAIQVETQRALMVTAIAL